MSRLTRFLAAEILVLLLAVAAAAGTLFLAWGLYLALLTWWASALWAALVTGVLMLAPALAALIALAARRQRRKGGQDEMLDLVLGQAARHPLAASAIALASGYLAARSPIAEALLARLLRESGRD